MTERKVFAREMVVDGEKKMVKLTQKELFTEILDKVADDELLTEFVNYQLDMLARKSANRTTKKESAEDVELMKDIIDIIGDNSVSTQDIIKDFSERGRYISSQKVTAIMKKLVDNGKVEKTVEKRVSYYTLVNED